jgi:hypothetical protein
MPKANIKTSHKESNADLRRSDIQAKKMLRVPTGLPKDVAELMRFYFRTCGHLDESHVHLVKRLAESAVLYDRINDRLSSEDLSEELVHGGTRSNPLIQARSRVLTDIAKLESNLGITVPSRHTNVAKADTTAPIQGTARVTEDNQHRVKIVA